jgi:hypothetical protein
MSASPQPRDLGAAEDPQQLGQFLDRLAGQGSFVLSARDAVSLQPLQAFCLRHAAVRCLTARYRVAWGPPVGLLLGAFASDLLGHRASPPVEPLGDLLPDLGDEAWAPVLGAPGWDALGELAYMPRLQQSAGLGAQWRNAFDRALGYRIPEDHRLVLFCEIEGDAGSERAWLEAYAALANLPDRVGVVFGGALPPLPPADELRLAHSEVGTGEEYGTVVTRFVESALSSDQPAELDQLGVAPLANGLARLILLPATRPLVLGVHAAWGAGKSTFMTFMREGLVRNSASARAALGDPLVAIDDAIARAEDAGEPLATLHQQRRQTLEDLERRARPDVLTVWFNAWRYETPTQVWAGLAAEITAVLEAALPWSARVRSRIAYALRKRTLDVWLGLVVPVLLALLAGAVLVWGGVRAADLPAGLRWLGVVLPVGAAGATALFVAWRVLAVLQPVSARVARYLQAPDYGAQLGFQHHVIGDLAFLRGRVARQLRGRDDAAAGPRVVVFIDDLDRCSDDSIMTTLQAINLVLGASEFFVVLGIDTDMIYRAIERRYALTEERGGTAERFAEAYLRKIIQLSVHLPLPAPERRSGLVGRMFSPEARAALAEAASQEAAPPGDGGRDGDGVGGASPGAGGEPGGLLAWDRAAIRSPLVQRMREVPDTPEELRAFGAYREFLPGNPRELKRLVNVHRLAKILLIRPDVPPSDADQRKLVIWLVFCARWPELVDDALRVARTDPGQAHVIRALQTGIDEIGGLAGLMGAIDAISSAELAENGVLARAARLSRLVRDEPAQLAASPS